MDEQPTHNPAEEPTIDRPAESDSADARLVAARRYMATVPIMADWGEQLATHLGATPDRREQLRALLAPHRDPIEATHAAMMVKHLTAAEIEALAQFQASRAGRSIMRKMGAFQAELVAALTPLLRSVAEDVLRVPPAAERP